MIDYDKFQKALKHLEVQYENYKTLDESYPDLIKEGIAESVLQRFEICFDSAWKTLRRYLSEELGLSDLPNSPKPVLRLANENELFAGGIAEWFRYLKARNDTSHDYSEEKAVAALEVVEAFIDDTIGLYQTMSGETWE